MQKSILFTILSTTMISFFLITGYSFADGDGHSLDAADGDPTDVVYVDNDGNVGVGTNSPLTDFHILGSSNSDILSIADGTLRWRFGTDSLNDLYLDPSSVVNRSVYIKNSGAGNTNLLIDGNVGIGTNNPTQKLDVQGNIEFGENSWGQLNQTAEGIRFNLQSGDLYFTKNGPVEFMRIKNDGNVGIGTTDPIQKLHVNSSSHTMITVSTDDDTANTWIQFGDSDIDVGGIVYRHNNDYMGFRTGNVSDQVILDSNGNVGIGTTSPELPLHVKGLGIRLENAVGTQKWGLGYSSNNFVLYDATNSYSPFTIEPNAGANSLYLKNGNVGIGTTSPQSKLAVNGTITTKEVNVTETGWSDFVFEENYPLPSLETIESFIKENKHLPDIPSAKEVKEQGLSVSEMMAKQMQKIEELTLYLIEMKKENEKLKSRITALEKHN